MKGIGGFTLVELMVVLAIAGVLLALSVPFGRYINDTATSSHLQEFAAALNLARSTAITSGAQVVICKPTEVTDKDGKSFKKCARTAEVCGSKTADDFVEWQNGWIIFIDKNEDCFITYGSADDPTDDDPIISIHEPLPSGYTLKGGKREDIRFSSLGFAVVSNTWTLCDPSQDVTLAKAVVMSQTGRLRFAKDTNKDGIRDVGSDKKPLACPGTDYEELQ